MSLENIIDRAGGSKDQRRFLNSAVKTIMADKEMRNKVGHLFYDDNNQWKGESADQYGARLVESLSGNYSRIEDYLNPGFFNKYLNPFKLKNVLGAVGLGFYGLASASFWMGNPASLYLSSVGAGAMSAADAIEIRNFKKAMNKVGADSSVPLVGKGTFLRPLAWYATGLSAATGLADYLHSKNKYQKLAAERVIYKSLNDFLASAGQDRARRVVSLDEMRHKHSASDRIVPATPGAVAAINAGYDSKHAKENDYRVAPRAA